MTAGGSSVKSRNLSPCFRTSLTGAIPLEPSSAGTGTAGSNATSIDWTLWIVSFSLSGESMAAILPVVDDGHPVAGEVRLLDIVGREKDRDPFLS